MASKKAVKKTAQKEAGINFNDTVKTFKTTAKTISRQLEALSDEIAVDLMENGEYIMENVDKKVKDTYAKVSDAVTVNSITKTTKSLNDYAVKTADDIVNETFANGKKWQQVGDKAVKGGLKLASKQQDLIFDTLETVKGQLINTTSRIAKLFSNN